MTIHSIDSTKGIGESVGTIRAADSKDGLVLHPKLKSLPPGKYGFHVHETPSCKLKEKAGLKMAGLAAGATLTPRKQGNMLARRVPAIWATFRH